MKERDELKTAGDFYEFFDKIPDSKWTTDEFIQDDGNAVWEDLPRCALGHCGITESNEKTPAASNLESLFTKYLHTANVVSVNDGLIKDFDQETPKARILSALKRIETLQLLSDKE